MGYQDRQYYRDGSSGAGNRLMWLLAGSVPLFTLFGIRVRAHASLVICVVLVLLFGLGDGFSGLDRFESMAVLFAIVLLHEFGHCFAARRVGGTAEDILMTPIGGLALAAAPRRWLPTLITVLGGPAVNVALCFVTGVILYAAFGQVPWNPLRFHPYIALHSWIETMRWLSWIFDISWTLLLFNLLPIFPLDGGQAVQAILWKFIGYYRSMNAACITGMVGAVIAAGLALTWGQSGFLLLMIAVSGFVTCLQLRRAILAEGPYAFSDFDEYDQPFTSVQPRRKPNRRKARRLEKLARVEVDERQSVDAILAKVSAKGMQSLSFFEKRTLQKATESQRKRDSELSKLRRG